MIINILLIILVIINPLLILYAYRKALQDTQKINNNQEIKTSVNLPKLPKKMTEEEKARLEKNNAIDNYTGW